MGKGRGERETMPARERTHLSRFVLRGCGFWAGTGGTVIFVALHSPVRPSVRPLPSRFTSWMDTKPEFLARTAKGKREEIEERTPLNNQTDAGASEMN